MINTSHQKKIKIDNRNSIIESKSVGYKNITTSENPKINIKDKSTDIPAQSPAANISDRKVESIIESKSVGFKNIATSENPKINIKDKSVDIPAQSPAANISDRKVDSIIESKSVGYKNIATSENPKINIKDKSADIPAQSPAANISDRKVDSITPPSKSNIKEGYAYNIGKANNISNSMLYGGPVDPNDPIYIKEINVGIRSLPDLQKRIHADTADRDAPHSHPASAIDGIVTIINGLYGVIGVPTGWQTDPTNLQNATDQDFLTSTGEGIYTDNVLNSPSYGSTIFSIAVSGSYVYAAGDTQVIRRYNIADLSFVDESPSYGARIWSIIVSGSYVYAAGDTTQTIRRYNIVDLSFVDESPSYGGIILSIAVSGSYVYAAGVTTQTIRRYNIVDLSFVDESPSYGGSIRSIAISGSYVYAAGDTTQTIRRYNIADLSFVDESPNYGGSIFSIAVSGSYVYAAGYTQTIRRYNIADLTFVDESPSYGSAIFSIAVSGSYVYAAGQTINKGFGYGVVERYNIADLSFVDESQGYGDNIWALVVLGNYAYVGGETTARIQRYDIPFTPSHIATITWDMGNIYPASVICLKIGLWAEIYDTANFQVLTSPDGIQYGLIIPSDISLSSTSNTEEILYINNQMLNVTRFLQIQLFTTLGSKAHLKIYEIIPIVYAI